MSSATTAPARFRFPSGMALVNKLCGAWSLLVFIFLYLPILLLVVYSFNQSDMGVEWTGFTLDWYKKLWNDTTLMDAARGCFISTDSRFSNCWARSSSSQWSSPR